MIEEIYEEEANDQDQKVIWGTNISTESVIKGLTHFFEEFDVVLGED